MSPATIIKRPQVATAVLVLTLALVGQLVAAGFKGWIRDALVSYKPSPLERMIADYDLLNSELVAFVDSDSGLDNILEALEWLKMSSGQLPPKPGLELPGKEALVRFTNLIGLMDPKNPKCDLSAYNILYENELATGTDISVTPEDLPPQRRVEAVIYEVAYQHAVQCRYVYPEQFARERKQVDDDLLKDIQRMMNAMIGTSKRLVFMPRDRKLDPRHVLARKSKGITGTGYEEARALLMRVRVRSVNDPETRYLHVLPDPRKRKHWIVDEAKVVQLLERFVYSRCEFLEGAFDHILKPADYDQQLFSDNSKYRAINENSAELMIWLEYYRLCQSMLTNKRELNANVLAAIWSELKEKASTG